jgi:exosortase E/protease (VPEID-CTERM system)
MASFGLPGRFALLAAFFLIELVSLSVAVDTAVLSHAGGLSGLIIPWVPQSLRAVVLFAGASLFLVTTGAKSGFQHISAGVRQTPISGTLIAVHLVLTAGLTWSLLALFRPGETGNPDWLTAVSVSVGVAAVAAAALAVVPAKFWRDMLSLFRQEILCAAVIAVFAVALARSGQWTSQAWMDLTFSAVKATLEFFLPDLIAVPSTFEIGTQRFSVIVAWECSGFEGMALMLAFGSAWLWFFRRECRFPQALLLIPAGMAAVWCLNVLRIAFLVLLGNAGFPGIAVGGFHSQAGWIAFTAMAILVILAFQRLPWVAIQQAPPDQAARRPDATTAYLAPFLAILAAGMLARAFSSSFEWLYPLRVLAAAGVLWYFRESYRDLEWRPASFALGAGALVFVLWIAYERVLPKADSAIGQTLASAQLPARVFWLAFRILGAVVTVPLAEELAFRGFLLRRFMAADFQAVNVRIWSWSAVIGSSIAFGLLHGSRWPVAIVAGAVYAWTFSRRGKLADAVVAHSATNALLSIWVLSTGQWQLW